MDSKNGYIRGPLKAKPPSIRKGWGPTGLTKQDFHDSYGHGTHVTRMLLKTAPLAEIYVAKVTENRDLDESRVGDIVKVCSNILHSP